MKLTVRYDGTQSYHRFTLVEVHGDDDPGHYTDGSNLLCEWLTTEIGALVPMHRRRRGYRPLWVRRTNSWDGHQFHIRDRAAAAAFRLRWC